MFSLNNIYHGFKLTEEERINEIDSIARVFEHVKSGARLLHLENKDDNKVFSISFRTTPMDDTGVPHIIEHAVLCGSKKFRTKDVFTDMAKSSLNTFINAMTFPDRTSYPIASRNHRDFLNLMEVYLDAVFYPSIYENHDLLRQEGWRYELDEETGKLIYKGIVYSEMQGALSSPESIMSDKIMGSLFPNTTYAVNSGGDPEFIPDLTQEDFENFHSKFYHPSNSYIYLYGDQDLNQCLKLINEEYLNNFDRIPVPSHIDDVETFKEMAEEIYEYSISEEENEEDKTLMALSFAGGETKNPDVYLPMKVLNKILVESASSPIKKALLDEGILTYEGYLDFVKNTMLAITVNNTNVDRKEDFKKIVFETLDSLVKNGIDKKLIEASINSLEFELREAELWGGRANKGMVYSLTVMDSWLYDESPLVHLKYEDKLNEMKSQIENNYFEQLIQKYLISNKHCSLVILKPKKGLAEKKAKELEAKLERYKETLTENDIKVLKERNARLKENQMRENTPEEIATLPKLSLNEIPKEIERVPQRVVEKNGIKLLVHNINTNKVAYIKLLFDANIIKEEHIPYIALLRDVLGKLDTNNRSYLDLDTEVLRKTGGISFDTLVFSDLKDENKYSAKFAIKSKVLTESIEDLFILIDEIITSTKFDKKRIEEVIKETKSKLKRYMVNVGHIVGMTRAASYFSKTSKFKDMINGVRYYEFICDIEKNFEERYDEIQSSLTQVYKTIFNRNNLIVSYTGEEDYVSSLEENLPIVINKLGEEKLEEAIISFEPSKDVEGVVTSSNVQYVVKAFNYNKLGYRYSGKMRVLQNIIDSEYLYTRVRLQGGAYGCYTTLENDGNIALHSYRDPSLTETIKTYDESDLFLKGIDYSKENMENFIIGAIGDLEKPLTPEKKGDKAIKNYICGVSNDDLQREKEELLSTSIEDVKAFAEMLKKGMEENHCCVVGNEMKINDNKKVFDKITVLL